LEQFICVMGLSGLNNRHGVLKALRIDVEGRAKVYQPNISLKGKTVAYAKGEAV
jgi:hypothetical protein